MKNVAIKDQWLSLALALFAWAVGLALIYAGVGLLFEGVWKAAPFLLLASAVALPPVRALLARRANFTMPTWLVAALVTVLAIPAFLLAGEQQGQLRAKKEKQQHFELQKLAQDRLDAQAMEFTAGKATILYDAQAKFDVGDVKGAWKILAKYSTITDPDLVRLRRFVRLAVLRDQLSSALPGEAAGKIYSEIAQLDPADSLAASEAREYEEAVAQRRRLDTQQAQQANMRPEDNPQVVAEARLAIQLSSYRCDSVSSIRRMLTKTGFEITCNNFRYSYAIADEGGRMVVRID